MADGGHQAWQAIEAGDQQAALTGEGRAEEGEIRRNQATDRGHYEA